MTTTTKATEGNSSNPLSVLGEALEAASASIGDARSDATASAKAAALKVQTGVGTGAYYTAYGVSYGLVFSGVFLKELLPVGNALRRGFEDGAHAAIDRAVKLRAENDGSDPDDHDEHINGDAEVARRRKS
jgi:hypothetical protein